MSCAITDIWEFGTSTVFKRTGNSVGAIITELLIGLMNSNCKFEIDTSELLVWIKYKLLEGVCKVQFDDGWSVVEEFKVCAEFTNKPVQNSSIEVPHTSAKSTVSEIAEWGMVCKSISNSCPI